MGNRAMRGSPSLVQLQWEPIENAGARGAPLARLLRAPVPGGWLVATSGMESVTFVPDPDAQWLSRDDMEVAQDISIS